MWLVVSVDIPDFFKSKQIVHCPILKIEPLAFDQQSAFYQAEAAEGLIITSKHTVSLIDPLLQKLTQKKSVFCVGPTTEKMMKLFYQGHYFLPQSFDQEGLVDLILQTKCLSLFYPKAEKIRPYLIGALEKNGCRVQTLNCYRTVASLISIDFDKQYTGIYFGSARCVETFYKTYQKLPESVIYVPGHVTKKTVEAYFGNQRDIRMIPF